MQLTQTVLASCNAKRKQAGITGPYQWPQFAPDLELRLLVTRSSGSAISSFSRFVCRRIGVE